MAEVCLSPLQILYLRMVYIFCQRMLAPGWGVLPHAVWGFKAYWHSLYLYPGVVITATIMVSTLVAVLCMLPPTLKSMLHFSPFLCCAFCLQM